MVNVDKKQTFMLALSKIEFQHGEAIEEGGCIWMFESA